MVEYYCFNSPKMKTLKKQTNKLKLEDEKSLFWGEGREEEALDYYWCFHYQWLLTTMLLLYSTAGENEMIKMLMG